MNYLYFSEDTPPSTTGTACMYPASSFLGLDPISATTTRLSFKARNNTMVDDWVLIEHASGKHKEVADLIAQALTPSSVTTNKFVVVADEDVKYLNLDKGAGLNSTVEITTVA